jgi:hypothetical protein
MPASSDGIAENGKYSEAKRGQVWFKVEVRVGYLQGEMKMLWLSGRSENIAHAKYSILGMGYE